ncbi:type I-C CRISPR-associated protein Cas8c/Csd1 [Macrococcus capreoli]
MTFELALMKTYDYAEEIGLVDDFNEDGATLLPLYHNNMRSNGQNIIEILLDKDSKLINAKFLEDKQIIIFPVTEKSIARSGANPPPHPLVDKIPYLIPSNDEKNASYLKEFDSWRLNTKNKLAKSFLEVIHKFLLSENWYKEVLNCIFGINNYYEKDFIVDIKSDGLNKKIDLSSVFATFKIENFDGVKDINITQCKELHKDYVYHVQKKYIPNGKCSLSGEEDFIIKNHRGLLGTAKIISVSNNKETYYGRFKKGSDINQIGYKSSEKFHLMLKYLLENKLSRRNLGEQQYFINWFSNDISNKANINIFEQEEFLFAEEMNSSDKTLITNKRNEKISKIFKGEFGTIDASDIYYCALIDKASNGRISLKIFKELQVSSLLRNLLIWQSDNSWYYKNKIDLLYKKFTPSNYNIIINTFGIEREGKMHIDNSNFRKKLEEELIRCIIEGRTIPKDFVNKANVNMKNRLNYRKCWGQVLSTSLAILNNQGEGEFNYMIDKNNVDRSYLFGRLLAVYERIEKSVFDSSESGDRVSNAEKYWTSYTNHPSAMMLRLEEKTKPYEKKLKSNDLKKGLYIKLMSEKRNIINEIYENSDSKDLNKPLSYQFIFGYYAELNYIFSKKGEMENE